MIMENVLEAVDGVSRIILTVSKRILTDEVITTGWGEAGARHIYVMILCTLHARAIRAAFERTPHV